MAAEGERGSETKPSCGWTTGAGFASDLGLGEHERD
jgi:hypothetical protein